MSAARDMMGALTLRELLEKPMPPEPAYVQARPLTAEDIAVLCERARHTGIREGWTEGYNQRAEHTRHNVREIVGQAIDEVADEIARRFEAATYIGETPEAHALTREWGAELEGTVREFGRLMREELHLP